MGFLQSITQHLAKGGRAARIWVLRLIENGDLLHLNRPATYSRRDDLQLLMVPVYR